MLWPKNTVLLQGLKDQQVIQFIHIELHISRVLNLREAVLEGDGTGVPGRTRQYSEGPG